MSIKSYWQSASKEIKNVKSLTGTAMLSALNPVLDMMTITINQFLYISFSSLALAVCGFLYGPVLSGISAVFVDVLKYMVHPKGPFFIGFTFNEFLIGLIFGLFFYKKKITLKRVIVAKATLVSIMYGQAFKIMVAARLIKNAILFPVDVAVLYGLLKFTETNIKKIRKDS
ncbi:MAG: folate family ECF transporter S component [Oscillospiraceae bacterium]